MLHRPVRRRRPLLSSQAAAELLEQRELLSGVVRLDPSFGVGGELNVPNVVEAGVQANGRVLVAQSLSTGFNTTTVVVAAFGENGQPDATYGTNGSTLLPPSTSKNATPLQLAVRQDGGAFIVGRTRIGTETGERFFAASVDGQGQLVNSFGHLGRLTFLPTDQDAILDVTADALGRMIFLRFNTATNTHYFQRFNLNGTPDTSIGPQGKEFFPTSNLVPTSILAAANGDIYVTARQTAALSGTQASLLRFAGTNGNFVNSVSISPAVTGTSTPSNTSIKLAEDAQGRLLVATTTNVTTGTVVTARLDVFRYSSSLAADAGFQFTHNTTGQGATVADLAPQPDGKLLIAVNQTSTQPAGQSPTIYRLNQVAVLDHTFGTGGQFRPAVNGRASGGLKLMPLRDGRLLTLLPLQRINSVSPPTVQLNRYLTGTIPTTGRAEDVYLFNPQNGQLSVQKSDGTGQGFTSQVVAQLTALEYRDPVTGDFDGDGRLDFAVRNRLGRWQVYLAATGEFSDWGVWNPNEPFSDVQVGDFNGDGLQDIIGRTSNGSWWVATSTGTTFVNRFFGQWQTTGWHSFQFGDFTGDGLTDVIGLQSSGGVVLGISIGNHFQVRNRGTIPGFATVRQVAVGDFDNDQIDDLAILTANGNWTLARFGAALSVQTSLMTQWTGTNFNVPVLVGDFNGDGAADLLGTATDGTWRVVQLNGTGFTSVDHFGLAPLGGTTRALVGDFNGDGRDDVATFNLQTGLFQTQLSTGSFFQQFRIGTIVPLNASFKLGAGEILPA